MIKEKQVYLFANATILQEIMLYSSRLREINKEIKRLQQEKEKIRNNLNAIKDLTIEFEKEYKEIRDVQN